VLHVSQYLTSLQAHWWPFCHIVALLSMATLFNHKAVSVRAAPPCAYGTTSAVKFSAPQRSPPDR